MIPFAQILLAIADSELRVESAQVCNDQGHAIPGPCQLQGNEARQAGMHDFPEDMQTVAYKYHSFSI